ncbi:hypothetical protein JHK82_052960 [Glycine max]|nr:hypothetical protein JHK82_052960 [Glycine max]
MSSICYYTYRRHIRRLSYVKKLGKCSSFITELWGLFWGLRLARQSGLWVVEVQVDSHAVCKSISSSIEGCASGSSFVPSIRSLINMDWQAHIVGIYREANCYVDALASMACDMGENFVIFEHSPNVLDTLL